MTDGAPAKVNQTYAHALLQKILNTLPGGVTEPGFKYVHALKKRLARPGTHTPRKLHLGCGEIHIEGYCNIDIDPLPTVDIVDDILSLRKFPENYAEQIYACHVLEHLGHAEVPKALGRWLAVLVPGGELRVSVPDIDRIVKIYSDNWVHFQTRGNSPWIGLLYGGQLDEYDYHKTGFNFCWTSMLLEEAGFVEIEEYPHEPHFIPGVTDGSLAREPFGKFLSLNIKARKRE
jgi:predicted SAM-dependent methyltransferase